jgi:uncharacterized membrane protein
MTVLESIANVVSSVRRHHEPVHAAATICATPPDVYAELLEVEHFSTWFLGLISVQELGPTRWRWIVEPGERIEWDVDLVEEITNKRLVWKSVGIDPAPFHLVMLLSSAPSRDTTEVRMRFGWEGDYRIPAPLLRTFTPDKIAADLRRLKQLIETGGILRVEGRGN